MTMPGFSAEASLYKSKGQYVGAPMALWAGGEAVKPATDWGYILYSFPVLLILLFCTWFPDTCFPTERDPECRRDSDCADNEYCHEGFLGFGKNECRSKVGIGGDCHRDGMCLSGCCKGGFLGAGAECKAAAECN